MRRLIALLLILAPLSLVSLGCGGETRPPIKHDPNWKDTTNPSNIVIPDSMKKAGPGGKTAPAPGGQK